MRKDAEDVLYKLNENIEWKLLAPSYLPHLVTTDFGVLCSFECLSC
jgi:hypothetical protein